MAAFKYGWFPIKGGYSPGASPSWSPSFLSDALQHSVLPALTLVITTLSGWVFGMRNNMINTLGEDYVTFAEANGLRGADDRAAVRGAQRAAAQRHRVRPDRWARWSAGRCWSRACSATRASGGLLFIAVTNHDFPLMQALFLVITLSMLVAIFIVDLLYVRLDPSGVRSA